MEKIFEAVKNNPLFQGIGHEDFEKILVCIEAKTQYYKKYCISEKL